MVCRHNFGQPGQNTAVPVIQTLQYIRAFAFSAGALCTFLDYQYEKESTGLIVAKIALIAGFVALGALTGGASAGLFGIGAGLGFGGSILGGLVGGATIGASVGKPAEEFMYAGTAARFEGEDDEN